MIGAVHLPRDRVTRRRGQRPALPGVRKGLFRRREPLHVLDKGEAIATDLPGVTEPHPRPHLQVDRQARRTLAAVGQVAWLGAAEGWICAPLVVALEAVGAEAYSPRSIF